MAGLEEAGLARASRKWSMDLKLESQVRLATCLDRQREHVGDRVQGAAASAAAGLRPQPGAWGCWSAVRGPIKSRVCSHMGMSWSLPGSSCLLASFSSHQLQ